MLIQIRAIVLYCQPYNDTTDIVATYTESFGRVSYLVGKKRSKKSTLRSAFFQPLTLVELHVEHTVNRNLQRIKDVRTFCPFTEILVDPIKSSMALFIAEVLYRTLRESEKNSPLFDFLCQSIQLLDASNQGVANFHLVFLLKLTRYLGFYPNVEGASEGWHFDLHDGCFVPKRPFHQAWLSPEESVAFTRIMRMSFENMHAFKFNHVERGQLLKQIIQYYRIHLPDFPTIKSLEVLQEMYR